MKRAATRVATRRERVPQAERRRITRAKLLGATIESLIEVGYARTTTVEVGKRAGLSRGAQLHHFPSRADLLVAAIEHLADERSQEFEDALKGRLDAGDEPIDAMVDMLWEMFSDPLYWATIELMVAARTDPELLGKLEPFERSLGGRIYGAFKELVGRGDREARTAIEMTLYFMRGLAVERIFRTNNAHYGELVEHWKKQLRVMLA